MVLRRAFAWVSTVAVAIVVALALPVSQLRTVAIIKACCCPDPSRCHCPDHQPEPSGQPTMRACHNTERAIHGAQLPAFEAPAIAVAPAPVAAVIVPPARLPAPHPAPHPARPDAPS